MSSDKRELFEALIEEVRRSQTATARFDQAVADAVGLNRTDMRCLDVLTRAGALTAGQLAAHTGLSSGAMTTALDRLERAGYARRVRDPDDRRRVVVEPTAAVDRLNAYYSEHLALSERLYGELSLAQIEFALWFFTQGRELNERRAAELERERRQRPTPPR